MFRNKNQEPDHKLAINLFLSKMAKSPADKKSNKT